MFSAFTPSPSAQWLTAMPVCLPRVAAASDWRNVLHVYVVHPLVEPAQERHRVLAGDERVARVEVHPQVGAIAEIEHPGHVSGLVVK